MESIWNKPESSRREDDFLFLAWGPKRRETVQGFSHLQTQIGFCFVVFFLFCFTGCLLFFVVLFQQLMIWVEDLEMCAFIFPGALSKNSERKKKTKRAHPSSDRLRATQARGGSRKVFRSVTFIQWRHQGLAAFDGGDVCLIGTSSPNLAKASAQNLHKKKVQTEEQPNSKNCRNKNMCKNNCTRNINNTKKKPVQKKKTVQIQAVQ